MIIHTGTNDITRDGSEIVATNIIDLAKYARSQKGVGQVLICSVTQRKDLGSFVYSRAESVNNRLRSISQKTAGKSFVDLRETLDRCHFSGLSRDAVHYNRAGAANALKMITASTSDFLA